MLMMMMVEHRVMCHCSGGVPLSVHGRHLASVSEPKIVVYVDNWQFTSVSSDDRPACCR